MLPSCYQNSVFSFPYFPFCPPLHYFINLAISTQSLRTTIRPSHILFSLSLTCPSLLFLYSFSFLPQPLHSRALPPAYPHLCLISLRPIHVVVST
jgi:hypothetical protein